MSATEQTSPGELISGRPNQSGNAPHFSVEMSLDQCIKCNICTTACPVSAATPLFPGPKFVGPQAARLRQPGQPSPDSSVDYCSGCRVCNSICPTGVKIAEINARARAAMVEQGRVPAQQRLRNNLIARAELIGKIGQPVAPLANFALSFAPLRSAADALLGIAKEAPFPKLAKQRFSDWFAEHRREAAQLQQGAPAQTRPSVVYFHGCAAQYYEPRVAKAAVYVLEANGFEVILPPQNCCGLPLLSNGEFAAARRYHQANVHNLAPFARRGLAIVGASTSCTLTLKEEAPELLDMHDEDTQLTASQTFDINEFLLGLLERDQMNLNLQPLPLILPYHIPCQYRAHRLGKPGLEVLSLIPELQIMESPAACCGTAGTYGYKKEKYPIAMQVGEELFDFVHRCQAPLVVCDSETCRWQITHGTGIPAIHPVELLAAAYGAPVEGALAQVLGV